MVGSSYGVFPTLNSNLTPIRYFSGRSKEKGDDWNKSGKLIDRPFFRGIMFYVRCKNVRFLKDLDY